MMMKTGYLCSKQASVQGVIRPCCSRSKTTSTADVRGQGAITERRECSMRSSGRRSAAVVCAGSSSSSFGRDLSAAPRFIQHKNEAKAFYAFLSQVYDYIVNPGTILMLYYGICIGSSIYILLLLFQGIGRWR